MTHLRQGDGSILRLSLSFAREKLPMNVFHLDEDGPLQSLLKSFDDITFLIKLQVFTLTGTTFISINVV